MTTKLYYFEGAGRAFSIRACLRAANYPFEDVRMNFEEWLKLKPTSPLGAMPYMSLPSGLVVPQSAALARWAAKLAGLYGKTPEDQLIIDVVMDTTGELVSKLPQNKDADTKKKLRLDFNAVENPRYLAFLSNLISSSGGPYVLGATFSVADLSLYGMVSFFVSGNVDFIPAEDSVGKFPVLMKHFEMAKKHPVIANEIAFDEKLKAAKAAAAPAKP
jgi:glutathione S-transferase